MLQTCNTAINDSIQTNDENGLSFEQFLLLAECNGARVEAFRSSYSTIDRLRQAIVTACRHTGMICVVSFGRKQLGQTGSGHFSPVGGYHVETDRVLILDVARFKYPAYWVTVSDLWKAMQDIDSSTGLTRGYFLMSRADNRRHAANSAPTDAFTPLNNFCRVAIDRTAWNALSAHFCETLPTLLANNKALTTPAQVFGEILRTLPVEVGTIFTKYSFDLAGRLSDCSVCDSNKDVTKPTAPQGLYQSYTSMLSEPPKHDNTSAAQHNHSHHHHHPHTRASIYSLLPLIEQIKTTALYKCLDQSIQLVIEDTRTIDNTANAVLSPDTPTHTVRVPLKYSLVSGLAQSSPDECRSVELELTALLLYACPEQIFESLSPVMQHQIASLRDVTVLPPQLRAEVSNLRTQLGILADYCGCSITHRDEKVEHGDGHGNVVHRHVKRAHRFVSHTRHRRSKPAVHAPNTTA